MTTEEKVEEGQKEEKKFPPALKYFFIGLICLILVLVVSSASIYFGVGQTFEFVGGLIVFTAITWVYFQIFAEYPVMKKAYWIFIGLSTLINLVYVVFSWTTGEIYRDDSLWSPSIVALLFFALAILSGAYLSSGSKLKILVSFLLLLLALLFFVLTAMTNGDEEGVRLMFIVVFSGEILIGWGFVRSTYPFKFFRNDVVYSWKTNIYFFINMMLVFAFAALAVILPYVAMTKWPLTNWQIVTAISSVPTAWFVVYAVWGRKFLK